MKNSSWFLDKFIYNNFNWKIIWIRFKFWVDKSKKDDWDDVTWWIRRRKFKDMIWVITGRINTLDVEYF